MKNIAYFILLCTSIFNLDAQSFSISDKKVEAIVYLDSVDFEDSIINATITIRNISEDCIYLPTSIGDSMVQGNYIFIRENELFFILGQTEELFGIINLGAWIRVRKLNSYSSIVFPARIKINSDLALGGMIKCNKDSNFGKVIIRIEYVPSDVGKRIIKTILNDEVAIKGTDYWDACVNLRSLYNLE